VRCDGINNSGSEGSKNPEPNTAGSTSKAASKGLEPLSGLTPMHVAAYVEQLGHTHSRPTVKQHLAAIRMLFDWLVTGHIT
jgi:integrase/recombinase XerD